MKGARVALWAIGLMAVLALAAATPELESVETELGLLEAASASSSPHAESVLAEAQKYADRKLAAATEESRSLLAQAAAAGRAEGEEAGPEAVKAKAAASADEVNRRLQRQKAKAEARRAAKRAAEAAKRAAAKAAAARRRAAANSPFRGQGLRHDKDGVFGAVRFGIAKKDAVPSGKNGSRRRRRRNHINRWRKHGRKRDIYGRKKSCLKDIAAHFDEKDIYESKRLSLLQRMDHASSRKTAYRLRRKLANLEQWHSVMQKKFLMSARELKAHKARVARLMDAYLPQALKDQLQANKVAKRAGQTLPFPHAHDLAMKVMRRKRKQIARNERLAERGHKRMIRPHIRNRGFPSMDPISSELRESLWRNIRTEKKWSTDRGQMELAENVVRRAHKEHGDFIDGPIAEPLLKGKLYNPETEKLGVPDFLKFFPWPKKPVATITMNDKVKVQQTYHQTW